MSSTATEVRERPILFNGDMVRAILSGAKTQTRRIITPQPECYPHTDWPESPEFVASFNPDGSICCGICMGRQQRCVPLRKGNAGATGIRNPFGMPGDRLWVRETCRAEVLHSVEGVRYLADDAFESIDDAEPALDSWRHLHAYRGEQGETVPSIHMPRWASRLTLEITDVRVERLNDISESDAIAEGAQSPGVPASITNVGAFAKLWESINGKGSWAANPWVWAITFTRL